MRTLWAALFCLLAGFSGASAETRILVPFPPGGPTDLLARALAEPFATALSTAVVPEYKVGADGVIATDAVAKGRPDGRLLLLGVSSALSVALASDTPPVPAYTLADFTPVCGVAEFGMGFAVSSDAPWKNLQEMIAYARAHPNVVTYAFSNVTTEAAGRQLEKLAGIKLRAVPYKGKSGGDAAMVVALLGRQVDMLSISAASLVPHVKAGTIRTLAVMNATRIPTLSEAPTVAEAGLKDWVPLVPWAGILAPARLPDAIRRPLEQACNDTVRSAAMQSFLYANAMQALPEESQSSEGFARYLEYQLKRWQSIVKQTTN